MSDWQRDSSGRLIEWAVVCDPSRVIEPGSISPTQEEAEAKRDRWYAWKEERRADMEREAEEAAALKVKGKLVPTNEARYHWSHGLSGSPVKDREWTVVRRTVSDWVRL